MNKKHILTCAFLLIFCHTTKAMFTTKVTRRPTRYQAAARKQVMQKRSIKTAIQPITQKSAAEKPVTMPAEKVLTRETQSTGYWSYLKNKLFGPQHIPAVTISTEAQTAETISPQQLFSWIDATKTLPEVKNLLQKLTQTAFDDIHIKAHIPENIWTNLIDKERTAINYIQHNCFSQKHPNATWNTDIPQELHDLMLATLNQMNINPASISVHYHDTVDIDPFGHDTISVTGPTIIYKGSMTSGEDIITGYEPAIITLHKQNISKLTKNQFLEKLQHTTTHLKEAHNEQIQLLKEALGSEKFDRYAQPYQQALEREADFLESIKNASIAKIVQRAFLEGAIDTTLKEIKNTRKKLAIENKETGLMVCAPPGELPQFLLDIESFDDMKKYIYKKKETIAREYLEGDKEFFALWKQENNEHYIEHLKNALYKNPDPNTIHDQDLPSFILEETKKLLIKVGINPLSVSILSKKNYTQFSGRDFPTSRTNGIIAGCASSAKIIKQGNKIIKTNNSIIAFNEDYFKGKTYNRIIFVIAHEIGHLLKLHSTVKSLQILRQEKGYSFSSTDDPLEVAQKASHQKDLLQQFESLMEIEADITYAMADPEIARIQFLAEITPITKGFSRAERTSAIHASLNERYHWIKKIVELHQKAAAQTQKNKPLFALEKE